jgi:hypothetical protein
MNSEALEWPRRPRSVLAIRDVGSGFSKATLVAPALSVEYKLRAESIEKFRIWKVVESLIVRMLINLCGFTGCACGSKMGKSEFTGPPITVSLETFRLSPGLHSSHQHVFS